MESEYEGIIGRKPFAHDTVFNRKGEARKPKMEPHESDSDERKYDRNIYFTHTFHEIHGCNDKEHAHHIIGDIPKRAIDIHWKERERMYPRQESRSCKEARKGSA